MTEGRDEIVEVVARAIAEIEYGDGYGQPWEPFICLARAIIPIVLEQAAKVTDLAAARAAFNSDSAPEHPGRYYLAEEVRKAVAQAIRALAKAPEGE